MSAVLKENGSAGTAGNEAQLREALSWETAHSASENKNTWQWLWEAVQGDFNDNRSTGQMAFDTAVSMIPLVDQICDVRDIIANCRAIAQSAEKEDNTWKWVALVLTLIGLFPGLGSLVKGVLKIFFVFVRRYGGSQISKAVDEALTWVVTLLRKKDVQDYLRQQKVDEVFQWLAQQVRAVRGRVNMQALLAAFDFGIGILKQMLHKVTWLPVVGEKARLTIALIEGVRRKADQHIAQALKPVQDILDAIVRRLDMEHLANRSGILTTSNVHFRGTLPEAQAVSLMRRADPLPPWLSKGRPGRFAPLDPRAVRADVKAAESRGWPVLSDNNLKSFHKLHADQIVGPAKLYRIVSPSSGAMGDCWVSEEVFHKIINADDPKSAWRKYLAVWPDWNANGQFVVYEIPKGQTLKVWRGEASSQVKGDSAALDFNLEGGWEQVIFKPTKDNGAQWDTMHVYQRTGNSGTLRPTSISAAEYRALAPSKQHAYLALRQQVNDPRIKGPFDTKWGSTDFDVQLQDAKIGLPTLPGQLTNQ
jgi:hypothetical protein